jgi:hypothetical protein
MLVLAAVDLKRFVDKTRGPTIDEDNDNTHFPRECLHLIGAR